MSAFYDSGPPPGIFAAKQYWSLPFRNSEELLALLKTSHTDASAKDLPYTSASATHPATVQDAKFTDIQVIAHCMLAAFQSCAAYDQFAYTQLLQSLIILGGGSMSHDPFDEQAHHSQQFNSYAGFAPGCWTDVPGGLYSSSDKTFDDLYKVMSRHQSEIEAMTSQPDGNEEKNPDGNEKIADEKLVEPGLPLYNCTTSNTFAIFGEDDDDECEFHPLRKDDTHKSSCNSSFSFDADHASTALLCKESDCANDTHKSNSVNNCHDCEFDSAHAGGGRAASPNLRTDESPEGHDHAGGGRAAPPNLRTEESPGGHGKHSTQHDEQKPAGSNQADAQLRAPAGMSDEQKPAGDEHVYHMCITASVVRKDDTHRHLDASQNELSAPDTHKSRSDEQQPASLSAQCAPDTHKTMMDECAPDTHKSRSAKLSDHIHASAHSGPDPGPFTQAPDPEPCMQAPDPAHVPHAEQKPARADFSAKNDLISAASQHANQQNSMFEFLSNLDVARCAYLSKIALASIFSEHDLIVSSTSHTCNNALLAAASTSSPAAAAAAAAATNISSTQFFDIGDRQHVTSDPKKLQRAISRTQRLGSSNKNCRHRRSKKSARSVSAPLKRANGKYSVDP